MPWSLVGQNLQLEEVGWCYSVIVLTNCGNDSKHRPLQIIFISSVKRIRWTYDWGIKNNNKNTIKFETEQSFTELNFKMPNWALEGLEGKFSYLNNNLPSLIINNLPSLIINNLPSLIMSSFSLDCLYPLYKITYPISFTLSYSTVSVLMWFLQRKNRMTTTISSHIVAKRVSWPRYRIRLLLCETSQWVLEQLDWPRWERQECYSKGCKGEKSVLGSLY